MNSLGRVTFKLSFFVFILIMFASIGLSSFYFSISYSENNKVLASNRSYLTKIPESKLSKVFRDEIYLSLEDTIDAENENLQNFLINLNLAILFIALSSSIFLARKILRPVHKMLEIQKRFITDASHELRTPLTAMKIEIEVNLLDKALTLEGAKTILGNNLIEIDKLSLLSNGLLSLAKYQEGRTVSLDRVYLKDKILTAYENVELIAKRKQIRFNFRIKNAQILGNEESLVRLFIILFDNAIKYSPKGSRISVRSETVDSFVVINIRDWGLGIAEADLGHIFDPFFRVENPKVRMHRGYGIGLSIAKNIVVSNKGTLQVSSLDGKGTIFTIKLPIYTKKKTLK